MAIKWQRYTGLEESKKRLAILTMKKEKKEKERGEREREERERGERERGERERERGEKRKRKRKEKTPDQRAGKNDPFA